MSGFKNCAALAAISAALGFCAPAQAGSAISAWVSGMGYDVSNCGVVDFPCRTFQYVHDNVLGPNGGEILVSDSGNYGPLNITKPVSVINDSAGTAGTGAPTGQTAITINTSGAVLLKGLILDGVKGAYAGVWVKGPGNVTIANCSVLNFNAYGVLIDPSAGNVSFSLVDTLVQNSSYGVATVGAGANSVVGDLINDRIVGNSGAGVYAAFAGTKLSIGDTLISRNADGLSANGAGTVVALRHSTITSNTIRGYDFASPAVVETYGDNAIAGNGGNYGTLTPVTPQ